MQHAYEPTIAVPTVRSPQVVPLATPSMPRQGRRAARYLPERGLVARLRNALTGDRLAALAKRHDLDDAFRQALNEGLIREDGDPDTAEGLAAGLGGSLRFSPLDADALHPFVMLAADRDLRATAMIRVGEAMRRSGRVVRLLSDAIDIQENVALREAGDRFGCAVTRYDGSPHCVELLRDTDLACLPVLEAGFRAPLDKVALLRLNTLIRATRSEPVLVMRPGDIDTALKLAKIGMQRVILAIRDPQEPLGPVFAALREGNLALSEILDERDGTMHPARPQFLAATMLA